MKPVYFILGERERPGNAPPPLASLVSCNVADTGLAPDPKQKEQVGTTARGASP